VQQAGASIAATVGETPIVRLSRFGAGLRHRIYAKCELMNPGGSVKDRIGFFMVEQAELRGDLQPGGTVVEATAGNTGLSLALAAAARGYRFIAVVTTKNSIDKIDLLRACGAEVEVVPHGRDGEGRAIFVERARAIARDLPGSWFADQFSNPDNPAAHYATTGPEIWRQSGGEIDVLVAGIGTGGTLNGAGRYLKERRPDLRLVLADPEGSVFNEYSATGRLAAPRPHGVEGIGPVFLPANARLDLLDEILCIPDTESVHTCLELFRTEGILAGSSSGCILAAARRYAARAGERELAVLALLPDGGRGYLSTIYSPEWRRANGF
jgi:cystathionine beta-synthase